MIKCKKFESAAYLLYIVNDIAKTNKFYELESTSSYNLGLLNYALSYYYEGIHHLIRSEIIIKNSKLSSFMLLKVYETLAFAYLNIFNFSTSFIYLKQIISMLSIKNDSSSYIKINEINIYLNFILILFYNIEQTLVAKKKKSEKKIKKIKDF